MLCYVMNWTTVYEPTAQYARRFRDVADVAYATAHHNADQERLLIKAFASGLKSNELARKRVDQSPVTIEAAIADVTGCLPTPRTGRAADGSWHDGEAGL